MDKLNLIDMNEKVSANLILSKGPLARMGTERTIESCQLKNK
jgi:hypothetical protein